jgi:hypothetical protein
VSRLGKISAENILILLPRLLSSCAPCWSVALCREYHLTEIEINDGLMRSFWWQYVATSAVLENHGYRWLRPWVPSPHCTESSELPGWLHLLSLPQSKWIFYAAERCKLQLVLTFAAYIVLKRTPWSFCHSRHTGGQRYPCSIPDRDMRFCLPHSVETGCEALPASCTLDIGAFSLEVKRSGREADHTYI